MVTHSVPIRQGGVVRTHACLRKSHLFAWQFVGVVTIDLELDNDSSQPSHAASGDDEEACFALNLNSLHDLVLQAKIASQKKLDPDEDTSSR